MQRLVGFDRQKHRITTEIKAGFTTFIAMAYILAVNPAMLSETGMDYGAAFVATTVAAALGTLLCAFIAKLPLVQAPAMGSNAFFAYTICLTMGYSWQFALTGVLIEGLLFILFSVTGVREWIVNLIPRSIKIGVGAGIGTLIALLGLKNSGIIVASPSTLVSMGDITQGNAALAMIGLLLMSVLIARKIKGALLIGIFITTLIGIPMGITIPNNHLFSMPPSIAPNLFQFEWENIFTTDMLIVVLILLSMDLFDTLGTLMSITQKTGNVSQKQFNRALLCDAIATTAGACLGTSTVGTYVESSAGIQSGGRTGLSSVVTAILLLSALFMAPVFLAIPAAAIGPALFLVGISMIGGAKEIVDGKDLTEVIPAIITMLMIPFTFSIANGIILGMVSYCIVNILNSGFKKVNWQMLIVTIVLSLKFLI